VPYTIRHDGALLDKEGNVLPELSHHMKNWFAPTLHADHLAEYLAEYSQAAARYGCVLTEDELENGIPGWATKERTALTVWINGVFEGNWFTREVRGFALQSQYTIVALFDSILCRLGSLPGIAHSGSWVTEALSRNRETERLSYAPFKFTFGTKLCPPCWPKPVVVPLAVEEPNRPIWTPDKIREVTVGVTGGTNTSSYSSNVTFGPMRGAPK
jgi:hypothetical protein